MRLIIGFITLTLLTVSTRPVLPMTPGMLSEKRPQSTTSTPKLVLVDRDGVINEDLGAPGVLDASKLKLTPGAGFALGRLRRAGYKVALVTNQSCVGKGLITESDLCNIHKRLLEMLSEEDQDAIFDTIFYCTSTKEMNDYRMKPNPGMVEEALELFGVDTAVAGDRNTVLFVGDTLTDLQAAARAGVSLRILVETGYGCGIMKGEQAPDVDGTVKVVNENESNVELVTTDNCANDLSKQSIFPFLYAKNFCSAVEWILKTETSS